ncbi:uncharacterized protein LOC110984115 [Acanthaster planci]|uniref:Uncharacterized protein LOC110984115 n=1 Tax=Acanthaster planci TaxID=133434 RepID=A0A8B7Z1Z7_ACAPL|nr:uncharacterized protein LOC110984115 [Acanthaster planci]
MCPDDLIRYTDVGRANTTVTLPAATTSDNSVTSLTVTTNPSGSPVLGIGNHTVTYTVTDDSGNPASCNITVTIRDEERPNLICPANITRHTDEGQSFATETYSPLVLSDNDGNMPNLTSDHPGNTFSIGETIVTLTARDLSGNEINCSFSIIVEDNEDPRLMCPDDLIRNTDVGQANTTVILPAATASDNSMTSLTVTTNPSGSPVLGIGNHTVTYTVTDDSGNPASCNITVTVRDKEPPNLMCPANITRQTDTDQSFATETYSPLVLSDNDGNMPNLTSDHPGNTFAIGETIVTLTARDLSGNEINCSFSITVEDSQPPALECPSEVIVYTDQLVFPLQFSGYASWTINVTDNSQMPLLRNESTHQSGSFFNTSITNVTHTVVDAYNNVNQCSFCVIIMGFVNTICNPSGSDLDLSELAGRGVRYHLLSPNFNISETYPSNSDCTWRISAPAGTHIRVRFEAFDTEFGKDVLTLGNGLDFALINTSLARYSGKLVELVNGTHHTKDRVYGNAIWLHFVSDQTFVQKFFGFWLQFDYISDPRSLYPASHSFCSEFDGFPCLDGSCVNISKRCDGVANDCPSNEDETDCPQVCSGSLPPQSANFTADNGVYYTDIVSDNYPGEYRPCNMRWNIDSNFVQSVRIVVMDIQIGAQDRLYIVDQGTGNAVTSDIDSLVSLHITSSTSLAVIFESSGGAQHGFWIRVWRYIPGRNDFLDFPAYCEKALHGVLCGTGTSGIATCFPDTERCDGDTDCLTFNNDERDCQAASYDCGNTTISLGNQGSMYHLTSVNYPADFLYGISCRYFVTTTAARILASFRDVEIPATTSNDYLRIGNGDTVSDATEILRVTGVFLPQDVVSEGNRLWFEFISDSSVNSRGFWIVLVAQG